MQQRALSVTLESMTMHVSHLLRNLHWLRVSVPLPSDKQHPSYDDCLEVKREYYQNCCVLDCVTQCSQSAAHLYEQFLQVQRIGFVTLGPLRCAYRRLYYCKMEWWFWWDSSLISTTNWFLSVL